jgi:hypothetical protein
MSSTHGKGSLYLCPQQPDFNLSDISCLVTALQEIGLISQKIHLQQSSHHYFTGDKYLDYIAYMGCAPSIQFEAGEHDADFCAVRLHRYDTAQLIHNQAPSRAPRCPACQKPVKDWQQARNGSTICCSHCRTSSQIEQFNWRKMAGYARLFIEITDIFPKEAIPQQLLIDKLSSISKTGWLYFYS